MVEANRSLLAREPTVTFVVFDSTLLVSDLRRSPPGSSMTPATPARRGAWRAPDACRRRHHAAWHGLHRRCSSETLPSSSALPSLGSPWSSRCGARPAWPSSATTAHVGHRLLRIGLCMAMNPASATSRSSHHRFTAARSATPCSTIERLLDSSTDATEHADHGLPRLDVHPHLPERLCN